MADIQTDQISIPMRDEATSSRLQGESSGRKTLKMMFKRDKLRERVRIGAAKIGYVKEVDEKEKEVKEDEKEKELRAVNLVANGLMLAAMFSGATAVPGGFDDVGFPKLFAYPSYLVYDISSNIAFALSSLSMFLNVCVLLSKGGKAKAILVDLISSLTLWAFVAFNIAYFSAKFLVQPDFRLSVNLGIGYAVFLIVIGFGICYHEGQSVLGFLKLFFTPVLMVLGIILDAIEFIRQYRRRQTVARIWV